MKRILLSILILFLSNSIIHAQNISGIINTYRPINNINQNILSVATSTGFNIGDKVMVIKMKGATINQTATAAYGDTISLGEVGKYVFSYIVGITPNCPLLKKLDTFWANKM